MAILHVTLDNLTEWQRFLQVSKSDEQNSHNEDSYAMWSSIRSPTRKVSFEQSQSGEHKSAL